MSLETFRGPDTVSALLLVEKRLGADAFIHTIETRGTAVVVTAEAARHAPPPAPASAPAPAVASAPAPTPAPAPTSVHSEAVKQAPSPTPAFAQASAQADAAVDAPAQAPKQAQSPTLAAASAPAQRAGAAPALAPSGLPAFLDSRRSKPFGTHGPATRANPLGGSGRQSVLTATKARSVISASRYIVLATLGHKGAFGVPVEFVIRFPGANLIDWKDGDALPWASAPVADAPDQGDPSTTLILSSAEGAALARLMLAASVQSDVCLLMVVPASIEAGALADLGKLAGFRIDGTIISGSMSSGGACTRHALTQVGLRPLWQFHNGVLSACPDTSELTSAPLILTPSMALPMPAEQIARA